MQKTTLAFTLIELLIYIVVSSILLYGVFFVFHITSDMIGDSQKFVFVYEEVDRFEEDLQKIDEKYSNNMFLTGSVFGKSELGFQACLFVPKDLSKGFIVGAINKQNGNLMIGNISNLAHIRPFTAEVNATTVSHILTNKNITNVSLSGAKLSSYDVDVLKLSCNKKLHYTKFDFVIAAELEETDIGKTLVNWNQDNNYKISFSIIK